MNANAAHNNALMIAKLSMQADNMSSAASKMLDAVNNASSLPEARKAIEDILTFAQRFNAIQEEQYCLKQRA